MNDKNTLKEMIENGRNKKNYSQRELARRIGLSNTSLSDLEKGKVQKPDIEVLSKISKELDISLEELLRVAGYEDVLSLLSNSGEKKSDDEDLRNFINDYREMKKDLIEWDTVKSLNAKNIETILDDIRNKSIQSEVGIKKYSNEELISDVQDALAILQMIKQTYNFDEISKEKVVGGDKNVG